MTRVPVLPLSPGGLPALVLAALVAACGGGAVGGAAGGSEPTDPPDSGTSSPPDSSTASTVDGGAGNDAAPCANTSSDPKNCGACGHDCLGQACSAGECVPEVVASVHLPLAIAVRGADLVVLDRGPELNSWLHFRRGSSAPGSTLVDIAGPQVNDIRMSRTIKVGGDYVYYRNDDVLYRRPLLGGGASDELIASDVESFDVDDTRVVYSAAGATYARPHGGGVTRIPSAAADPARSLTFSQISLAGSSAHAMVGDGVLALPTDGSPSTNVSLTTSGLPTFADSFVTTPSAFVGTRFQYSNPVSCGTSTFAIWQAPRAGGPATAALSGNGWVPALAADATGFVYVQRPCSGSVTPIMSRRTTAAAAVAVATIDNPDAWSIAPSHVYFVQQIPAVGKFDVKIARVPR